jgi:hypothetical protein
MGSRVWTPASTQVTGQRKKTQSLLTYQCRVRWARPLDPYRSTNSAEEEYDTSDEEGHDLGATAILARVRYSNGIYFQHNRRCERC